MISWLRAPLGRAEIIGYLIFVAGFAVLVVSGRWHDSSVQYGALLMAIGAGVAGRGQAASATRPFRGND